MTLKLITHVIFIKFQKLSPSQTGGIFVISGAFYALFNQVWAYLAEKMDNVHPLCFFGFLCSLFAFSVVGPLPFFPSEPLVEYFRIFTWTKNYIQS